MKKHNFYAGPSILPEFTKENTAEAVMNFAGTGLSVMEVSHRSKEFVAVMDEAVALVKELLKVPVTAEIRSAPVTSGVAQDRMFAFMVSQGFCMVEYVYSKAEKSA